MGYPCAHACVALLSVKPELGMELDRQIETFFGSNNYKACYYGAIIVPELPQSSDPVPGDTEEPKMCKWKHGRPRKRFIESGDAGRRTVTFSMCEKRGLSRGSCQEPVTLH